jgi:hypothetical protein
MPSVTLPRTTCLAVIPCGEVCAKSTIAVELTDGLLCASAYHSSATLNQCKMERAASKRLVKKHKMNGMQPFSLLSFH